MRPRRCHGQRRLRPNRCPPLHSVTRPAQCHGQLPLSLNRCPQWPACHLLAGHLLQPNCRPQCHNKRLLRLNCCPLANPTPAPGHVVHQRLTALVLLGPHLCREVLQLRGRWPAQLWVTSGRDGGFTANGASRLCQRTTFFTHARRSGSIKRRCGKARPWT